MRHLKAPRICRLLHLRLSAYQPKGLRFRLDESSVAGHSLKTNMAKTTGWSPKGTRLTCHAPFGHWNTQTFIAASRHDRLDAPWVINGAMNRDLFELYVETQLAPTLHTGDVIILDNLSSHKSPKAAKAMRAVGAWFLFLPPYSPDLNPIEMAFAKSSRHLSEELLHGPTTISGAPLDTPVISSPTRNATTSSKPLVMKPIERNTL
ncbi:hypothetical protein C6W92_16475 [Roseovarius sp. A46]|nr:hypothetical protein C6W92_16475 [Roseovarius sp. A46]